MAISKHIFANTSAGEAHTNELYDYLAANASDYFDSITRAEDGSITCSVSGGGSILFTANIANQVYITVTLANGTSQSINANASNLITEAQKTSNGIMFFNTQAFTSNNLTLAITKSSAGNAFAYLKYQSSASSTFYADLKVSPTFIVGISPGVSSSLTALTPFVASGGVFAPNLFFTYYSEYYGVKSVISMGGREYVYSGIVALAD